MNKAIATLGRDDKHKIQCDFCDYANDLLLHSLFSIKILLLCHLRFNRLQLIILVKISGHVFLISFNSRLIRCPKVVQLVGVRLSYLMQKKRGNKKVSTPHSRRQRLTTVKGKTHVPKIKQKCPHCQSRFPPSKISTHQSICYQQSKANAVTKVRKKLGIKFAKEEGGITSEDQSMRSDKSHHTSVPKPPRASVHSKRLQFRH